jgi:hypothetical protein
MVDARYDKVNPDVGLFRAPLAADISSGAVSSSGGYGPVAVSLNASGQVVIGTGGQSGFVGVMVKNFPSYPRLGNIPGQPNLAVPIGGKAGNIVDIMTAGEITNGTGWVAGTAYYAGADGTLTTNPGDGALAGWTVGADRMVVRADVGGVPGSGSSGTTALGTPVANTVTETPIQTINLTANEVVAGSIYELKGSGVFSATGTPTLQFTARLGGIAGTSLVTFDTAPTMPAIVGASFDYELTVNFQSATKATAKLKVTADSSITTDAVSIYLKTTAAQVTVATNVTQTLGLDVTWSVASASNTLTVTQARAGRVA